ncbi:hypothetical protein IFR05_007533 [Cadophora sp. M221]|nr:hypothetical protein IFR05_007533 [Cadophora sp. M221]
MRLLPILAVALSVCRVQAKAVFAHFMVGNVPTWDVATWQADIRVAQAARIDAFALNIAFGDPNNLATLSRAFQAANILGFKLFFSFDYAGGTRPWPQSDVTSLILQYRANGAYFQYNGKPFVSTFEGPDSAPQWAAIKSATNCFFIPDWSSKGAAVAMTLGNADGLFNWAAWPYGQNDMYTVIDASYRNFLGGKPYMMAVSPWFYTNMPGYDKNWMWKGENLWFDRWGQVQVVQPEFVQIISWNDFGESHYIGPLHDDSYGAFETGRAPFNYVKGMPHDGWRVFLPYLISTYKNNISSIAQEALSVWYRVNPTTSGCSFGGTTGNTLSQQQCEYNPADIVRDRVHYTALLSSPNSVVTVTIGGVASTGTWRNIPDGGIGLYQGNAFFNGRTGPVVVTVQSPAGTTTVNGAPITNSCPNGNLQNWNAWTGSAIGPTNPATPPRRTDQQQCIAGTGVGNIAGLWGQIFFEMKADRHQVLSHVNTDIAHCLPAHAPNWDFLQRLRHHLWANPVIQLPLWIIHMMVFATLPVIMVTARQPHVAMSKSRSIPLPLKAHSQFAGDKAVPLVTALVIWRDSAPWLGKFSQKIAQDYVLHTR